MLFPLRQDDIIVAKTIVCNPDIPADMEQFQLDGISVQFLTPAFLIDHKDIRLFSLMLVQSPFDAPESVPLLEDGPNNLCKYLYNYDIFKNNKIVSIVFLIIFDRSNFL